MSQPAAIWIKVSDNDTPMLIMVNKIESVQDLGSLRIIWFTSGRKVATDMSITEIEALINGSRYDWEGVHNESIA